MFSTRFSVAAGSTLLFLGVWVACSRSQVAPPQEPPKPDAPAVQKPQTRLHGQAIGVDTASVSIDDGDSVFIRWANGDLETVRILGIDTPETRHDEHGIPIAQPFGPEARAFAQGAFAVATRYQDDPRRHARPLRPDPRLSHPERQELLRSGHPGAVV